MKLLLVRHGETIENKKRIMQGHSPGELSKDGIRQAELLAKRLSNIKIDIIFTSDLKRALDTAKIILKSHPKAKFIEDKRLRERDIGIYTGKPRIVKFYNLRFLFRYLLRYTFFSRFNNITLYHTPKGGESLVDVRKRIEDFYKNILKKYKKGTIMIVSHGGPLMILTGLILNKDLKETIRTVKRPENIAVTEFDI